jgi:hypothetical protein
LSTLEVLSLQSLTSITDAQAKSLAQIKWVSCLSEVQSLIDEYKKP